MLIAPPSIGDLLVHSLSYDTDRPVIVFSDTGRVMSAEQYREMVSRYCQALADLNLPSGTRIGLLSQNRPEVLFLHGAVAFLDLCLVTVHPAVSHDDLTFMLTNADVKAFIFDPQPYEDLAARLARDTSSSPQLLALGASAVACDLTALAAVYEPAPLVSEQRDPEDIVRLSYSGGTTGTPKAIMGSGRYLGAAADVMLKEWEWPDEVRHLVCSPLSHGGGAVFVPTMVKRGCLVVLPGFDATAVLEAIQRYRITSVLLVPTMIYALLDHPRLHEYDLSSLQLIYYGASAISPARLREGIEKLGSVFFQFYGQAEAPMSICTMRRDQHDPSDPNRLAACGRPVPWLRVQLLDEHCRPVADGEPGEICVQGPMLMSGYLNEPELTAEAFQGGWLHTGDLAVRDPDGFLRLVDRKKDMIVTGGFNVFPGEIEKVLSAHPDVAEVAVIGVPDERWGEAVTALVVPRGDREGPAVSEAELIKAVRDRKGAVQAPKSVIFVDAIPLSPLGKPDKKALRAAYAAPGRRGPSS